MVNNQFREQYVDTVSSICTSRKWPASTSSPTATHISTRDVGGQSWTNYPPRHMGGFDNNPQPTPAGKGGLVFPPGHILHDYLEARVMPGIVGPVTPRRTAICRDVEGRAAHDQEAGQVRHHRAGAGRLRGAGQALQVDQGPHPGDRRRPERGTARARRRRLPGDPVRGAADPPAGDTQDRRRRDQSGLQRRGVQSHGEGPARQNRSVVPHLLGQSVAAAHVQGSAELQGRAGDAEQGRCRRDHLRVGQRRRHGSGSLRQGHLPTRKSPSASSTIIRCRSRGRRRSPTTSAARSNTSRPSGW